MAAPEQSLPGDELPNNISETHSINNKIRNNSTESRILDRQHYQAAGNRGQTISRNPNWYDPADSDFSPLANQRRQETPRHYNHHDCDLPPEKNNNFDVDDFHNSVADNQEQWQDFQVTDRAAMAGRELDNLSDEEKLKRINAINEYNRRKRQEDQNNELNFRHEKAKGWFALQLFIGYGLSSLFMIFIVVFTGLFIYTTFKDGTLNDNGIGVGILNTIQEVLRIIFSPGPGDGL